MRTKGSSADSVGPGMSRVFLVATLAAVVGSIAGFTFGYAGGRRTGRRIGVLDGLLRQKKLCVESAYPSLRIIDTVDSGAGRAAGCDLALHLDGAVSQLLMAPPHAQTRYGIDIPVDWALVREAREYLDATRKRRSESKPPETLDGAP